MSHDSPELWDEEAAQLTIKIDRQECSQSLNKDVADCNLWSNDG